MTLKGYYLRIQLIQVYNMFNNKLYKEKYYNLDLSNFSFLITGGAGFIGSNIVEYLLRHNAGHIRILDNLSNGYFENIRDFLEHNNVEFVQGDIRDLETCGKGHALYLSSSCIGVSTSFNTQSYNHQ